VPPRERRAVVAIYRFARAADDLADEGDAPPHERLAALDRYSAPSRRSRPAPRPVLAEPPFAELARAVREQRLPTGLLADLLSAFAQDVTVHRYATFAQLRDYTRRSADPVGRLLLALYARTSDANVAMSDAICTGLQLANFWQDVAVDWAKGRVYLPQDAMARHGVTEAQIAEGRCDAAWRALMREMTAQARAMLVSGRPLASRCPGASGSSSARSSRAASRSATASMRSAATCSGGAPSSPRGTGRA
jgi:squalene synthase HpnC